MTAIVARLRAWIAFINRTFALSFLS